MISVVSAAFGASAATSMTPSLHAQHGVALLVGVETNVVVIADGARRVGRVVVVPADVAHSVESPGPVLGFLFDPEALPHVMGYAREGGARVLDDELAKYTAGAVTTHAAVLHRRSVLAGIGSEVAAALRHATPARVDRRVLRAVRALDDPTAELRRVVAASGIGEAHLQTLFARDIGIPMRNYRLWQRLVAATIALRAVDATRAAHAAGFSDLAHFSCTCRRMLGYTTTAMRAALTTEE